MLVNQSCFSWNLAKNESGANVCLPTLFQRWQNNVEAALKLFRPFNIDGLMFFQYWYLVEKLSQRIFIGLASVLRKEHWNNFTNISGTDVYYKVAQ